MSLHLTRDRTIKFIHVIREQTALLCVYQEFISNHRCEVRNKIGHYNLLLHYREIFKCLGNPILTAPMERRSRGTKTVPMLSPRQFRKHA